MLDRIIFFLGQNIIASNQKFPNQSQQQTSTRYSFFLDFKINNTPEVRKRAFVGCQSLFSCDKHATHEIKQHHDNNSSSM
jgi:hypothetical protein